MPKKGELAYTTVMDLVLVCTVTLILFSFYADVAKDDYFQKGYLARDLALTLESIQGPGTHQFIYRQDDLENYTFAVKDGQLRVFRGKPESYASYPFYVDESSKQAFAMLTRTKDIRLSSCKDWVVMDAKPHPCLPACKEAKGSASSLLLIQLSTAGLLAQPEEVLRAKYSEDIVKRVRDNQRSIAQASIKEPGVTATADVMIGIRAGVEPKVVFPPGDIESENLACHVVGALKERSIMAIALPGSSPVFTGKTSVVIETDPAIPADDVAGALINGLERFYGA